MQFLHIHRYRYAGERCCSLTARAGWEVEKKKKKDSFRIKKMPHLRYLVLKKHIHQHLRGNDGNQTENKLLLHLLFIYSSRWRKSKYKSGHLGQSYINSLTSAWGVHLKTQPVYFGGKGIQQSQLGLPVHTYPVYFRHQSV